MDIYLDLAVLPGNWKVFSKDGAREVTLAFLPFFFFFFFYNKFINNKTYWIE